uniref:Uncharacterized protein n=1 Tax=Knipowitschia caucasica TaxID=637954 RepID=A0AAV2LT98_KNICA
MKTMKRGLAHRLSGRLRHYGTPVSWNQPRTNHPHWIAYVVFSTFSTNNSTVFLVSPEDCHCRRSSSRGSGLVVVESSWLPPSRCFPWAVARLLSPSISLQLELEQSQMLHGCTTLCRPSPSLQQDRAQRGG